MCIVAAVGDFITDGGAISLAESKRVQLALKIGDRLP